MSGFDKKIRKIVIGNGIGGLKLSHYAVKMLAEKLKSNYYYDGSFWVIYTEKVVEKLKFKLQKKSKKQFDFSVSCGFFIENFDLTNKDDFPATAWSFFDFRDNYLVEIAEELGLAFLISGHSFKIVEIPFDVKYNIECDDSGREWVAEVHRIWN